MSYIPSCSPIHHFRKTSRMCSTLKSLSPIVNNFSIYAKLHFMAFWFCYTRNPYVSNLWNWISTFMMGIKNIIEEVGGESSSLKLNNYSPSFVAITHFHPHLNSSLKAIMRSFLTTKSPTVAFVGSNPTILIAPNPIM